VVVKAAVVDQEEEAVAEEIIITAISKRDTKSPSYEFI
jgi:hypothetical protein